METHYRKLIGLLVILSTAFLSGCGPKVMFSSVDEYASTNADSKPRAHFKPITAAQYANLLTQGVWSTSTVERESDRDKTYYIAEYSLSYGDILVPISRVIDDLLPQACDVAGLPGKGTSYYRNEIPCGQIGYDNWKTLLQVNTNQQWGWAGSNKYWIGSLNFPVRISRRNNTGMYTEPSLDSKTEETKRSSDIMGDDIAIRFKPKGNLIDMEFCVNVPGTQVSAPKTYVPATVEQDLWVTSVTLNADMEVNPGIVEFDYIRQCFNVEAGFNADDGTPLASVTKMGGAHVERAQLNGTQIYFVNWFTQVIDFVLNIFDVNVRNEISKYAQSEVGQISKNDFDSGSWLVQVTQGTMGERYTREIGKNIEARISNRSLSTSAPGFRQIFFQQCERLAALTPAGDAQRYSTRFCREVLDHVELAIEPFAYDAAMDQAGCYSYFANIHKGHNDRLWWNKQCRFKIRFMVGISKDAEKTIELIGKLLTTLIDGAKNTFDANQAQIDQGLRMLNLDYLDTVIAQIKAEGHEDVSLEDLKSYFDKAPDQVKNLFLK